MNLFEFYDLGREHSYMESVHPLIRAFTWLFGPISLHPRISAGHVLNRIKRLQLPVDAHILDAGCGRALTLFWLAKRYPRYQLRGIEIDSEKVARNCNLARTLKLDKQVIFEQGDLVTCSLGHKIFDLIISLDVLEHITDDMVVLSHFKRALKPGGLLLLHLPLRHQYQRRILQVFSKHIIQEHVRDEYLPVEILDKLEQSGFKPLELCYGFGWQGELAFELNNLFWDSPKLQAVTAIVTYPLSWWLGYWDTCVSHTRGNSMIILAQSF